MSIAFPIFIFFALLVAPAAIVSWVVSKLLRIPEGQVFPFMLILSFIGNAAMVWPYAVQW